MDEPAFRAMVDTGASVRYIVAYIREYLNDPECYVEIRFVTGFGWLGEVHTTRGATIRSSYGDEMIETLVELFDKLMACAKRSEEANGRVNGVLSTDAEAH